VNSKAYQKLHKLALHIEVDDSEEDRIALYLLLIPARFKWDSHDAQYRKDNALELLLGLEDSEWEEIRKNMIDFITKSITFRTRLDWVRALDTYREFERDK